MALIGFETATSNQWSLALQHWPEKIAKLKTLSFFCVFSNNAGTCFIGDVVQRFIENYKSFINLSAGSGNNGTKRQNIVNIFPI